MDQNGNPDQAQAPQSGADGGSTNPPEAPQVKEQVTETTRTETTETSGDATQLAADGDAVREGVQEGGDSTNA